MRVLVGLGQALCRFNHPWDTAVTRARLKFGREAQTRRSEVLVTVSITFSTSLRLRPRRAVGGSAGLKIQAVQTTLVCHYVNVEMLCTLSTSQSAFGLGVMAVPSRCCSAAVRPALP